MGKLAGGFIDVYLLEKSRYICCFEKQNFVKKKEEEKTFFLCWDLSKSVWNLRHFHIFLASINFDVLICALRVTYQQPNERCYHIFFQLIEPGIVDGLQELVLMSTDPYDYFL